MHKIISLCILLLLNMPGFAQDTSYFQTDTDPDNYTETVAPDTGNFSSQVQGDTSLIFRQVGSATDSIREWRSLKRFAYLKTLDSLLKEKKKPDENDRRNRLSMPRGSNPFGSVVLKTILWLLAGALIIYILFQLFMNKGMFRKSVTAKAVNEKEIVEPEDISGSNFDSLLRKAYLAGDMRVATRYLFLKTLQKLNEKELIIFSPDKTNANYLAEMPEKHRNSFATLALYYEYVWYGNMALMQNDFDNIEKHYNIFLTSL